MNAKRKNRRGSQPPEPPFANDNMSTWQRESGSSTPKDKEKNQVEDLPALSQFEQSRFKRKDMDKTQQPAEMSKLLSFGYVDGSKPQE